MNLSKKLASHAKFPGGYLSIHGYIQPMAPAKLLIGFMLVTNAASSLAASGDLDTSFGIGGSISIHLGPAAAGEDAHSVAVQADGKILLGGGGKRLARAHFFATG